MVANAFKNRMLLACLRGKFNQRLKNLMEGIVTKQCPANQLSRDASDDELDLSKGSLGAGSSFHRLFLYFLERLPN